MKKIIRIITFNLLLIVFLFLLIDYICYKIQVKEDYSGWAVQTKFTDAYTFLPIKNFMQNYKTFYENKTENAWFRKDELKENNKREIVLFGCSFTYGVGLEDNQTFSYKLSNYTKRSVFNRGIPGCGTNHMLYMIREGLSSEIKNPKYFIYTFIEGHLYRLYIPASFFHNILVYYKYKDKELIRQNDIDIWHWHSYTLRTLYEQLEYKNIMHKEDTKIQFLQNHILKANKEIKKNYPNSEFVVFAYSGEDRIKRIENELKSDNIEVIYLSELSDKDFTKKPYVLEDDHPSAEAWDIIIPELTKKLSL